MLFRAVIICLLTLAALDAAEPRTVEPKEMAAQLRRPGQKPVVLYVGFAVLYKKHIPGAIFAGPTSRAEGVKTLQAAVAAFPRSREIVVYCGCCPWDMCPNIKPAVDALKQMGFAKITILKIDTSFAANWTDQGYPVEQAAPPK